MPWGRHLGEVLISQNALQYYPEFHGTDMGGTLPGPARGVPCQVQPGGGYPTGGVPCREGYPAGGPCWGVPCQGVPCLDGVPWQGGYPAGGYPGRVPPQPGQDGGGTQVGQQKEYSIHGWRYASYVHAGGLSCLKQGRVVCVFHVSILFFISWKSMGFTRWLG